QSPVLLHAGASRVGEVGVRARLLPAHGDERVDPDGCLGAGPRRSGDVAAEQALLARRDRDAALDDLGGDRQQADQRAHAAAAAALALRARLDAHGDAEDEGGVAEGRALDGAARWWPLQ